MATAMFRSIKDLAVFNAKPHLFTYGEPFQFCESFCVELVSGDVDLFVSRVEQFGGLVIGVGMEA